MGKEFADPESSSAQPTRKASLLSLVLDRIDDSVNALGFRTAPWWVNVHTPDGDQGLISGVNVLRGIINVKGSDGKVKSIRGRLVADIDDMI